MYKLLNLAVTATALLVPLSWGTDFRDNDWGDPPEAVQAKEGKGYVCQMRRPQWGDEVYTGAIGYYPSNHLGVNGVVLFGFTRYEKLGKGSCFARDNDILSFGYWAEALSKSYGEPTNRDDVLTNNEELLARYYCGDAPAVEDGIRKGYFTLIRYWETQNTFIWLVAEFYEGNLEVHIDYYAKEYFDFFREEKTRDGPPKGFRPWFDNDAQ